MFETLGARLDDWLHSVKLRRIRLMRRLGLLPKPTPEQLRVAELWNRAMERIAPFAPYLSEASDYSVNPPTDLRVKQALAIVERVTFRAEGADLKCTVSDGEPLESIETLNWRLPPHG
jgi:hypothetical protein